jgi:hypothetical protein
MEKSMAIRVLFLLLAFLVMTNLVILLLNVVFNCNFYKTHGRLIANCYGILAIIIIILYVVLSVLGIK